MLAAMKMGVHILLLVLAIHLSVTSSLSRPGPGRPTSDTLYNQADPVLQLNKSSFPVEIRNPRTALIVEFYATWCGHCQRFAATWLQFAHDVKGWSDVIRVAAVACSDPDNAPVCRQVNIRGYPTIKLFRPGSALDSTGFSYQGAKDVPTLRKSSIQFVERVVSGGNAPLHWPRLLPFRGSEDIVAAYPTATRVFLIAADENEDAFLPQQVILDTAHLRPGVVVGRLSEAGVPNEYRQRPILFSVARRGGLRAVPRATSREEMSDFIRNPSDHHDHEEIKSSTNIYPSSTVASFPFQPSDGLHMQDLESSLYYSFWLEVGAFQTMRPIDFRALKEHVRVMAKYHPGNAYIRNFLKKTNEWLQNVTQPLSGADWVNGISNLQSADAYVPDRVEWTGCQGSLPRFRGYPCSLWMTFHALTVSAYKNRNHDANFDPQEVLKSMRDYITVFMGCRECARHFAHMAASIEEDVLSPSDGVTWLWEAHNKVNNRLHGDHTEDPRQLKIQFPAYVACPVCRSDEGVGLFQVEADWEHNQVLDYLNNFYGKNNIIQDALEYTFRRQDHSQNPLQSTPFPRTLSPSTIHHRPASSTLTPLNNLTPTPCPVTNTQWTSCSTTCGAGTSTRLSNDNHQCRMKLEMRICYLRPCGANFGDWSSSIRREQCSVYGTTYKSSIPIPLKFGNCQTLAIAQWRFCGLCPGKCCYPTSRDNTIELDVMCGERGLLGKAKVHYIAACQCEDSCPNV